jgi:hypothetical protein
LLIAMERYDDAEALLDRLSASEIHGSVAHIVDGLQSEIVAKRRDSGTPAHPKLSENTQP